MQIQNMTIDCLLNSMIIRQRLIQDLLGGTSAEQTPDMIQLLYRVGLISGRVRDALLVADPINYSEEITSRNRWILKEILLYHGLRVRDGIEMLSTGIHAIQCHCDEGDISKELAAMAIEWLRCLDDGNEDVRLVALAKEAAH